MPIQHAIWQVGQPATQLKPSKLTSEALLEQMIVQDPSILSPAWMLIGQQETTAHGGRIDLLAIAPDGSLVLVELKRDRTPREIVAQALDEDSLNQAHQIIAVAANATGLPSDQPPAPNRAAAASPSSTAVDNWVHPLNLPARYGSTPPPCSTAATSPS